MPLRLDSQSADFSTRFRAFLAVKREAAQDVEESVRRILAEVKAYGDRALLHYGNGQSFDAPDAELPWFGEVQREVVSHLFMAP